MKGRVFDYDLPAAMAGRLPAGREPGRGSVFRRKNPIANQSSPSASYSGGEETFEIEHRAGVHRYHADYVAADLAWRAAQLMPDNDEQTANVLKRRLVVEKR